MDKYKALEAIKNSDWRPLVVAEIEKQTAALMEKFVWDIQENAYEKKRNDLHLVQAQINTCKRLEGILDRMMMEEKPMVVQENKI